MRAFWRLSTTRQFGGGVVGPIPWDQIIRYANLKGLDPEMRNVFETVMDELDEAYREYCQQEQRAAESKIRSKSKGGKATW